MQCCDVSENAEMKPVDADEPTHTARWVRIIVSGFIAVNSMAVGLAVNLSTMPAAHRATVETLLLLATIVVAVLLAPPLVRRAFSRLREGSLSAELLFIAGIVGAVGVSIMTMLSGTGDVYFEVASILLVLYAIGDEVSAASKRQGITAARDWANLAPTCRVRSCCGKERTIPVEDVDVGQRVVVHPGESIPVDGEVLEGESLLAEEHVTGEAAPAVKRPGDSVFAGAHVLDCTLVVKTTRPAGARLIDEIVESVQNAWSRPSKYQREADRVVAWFFPTVAVATLLTFAGWSWFVDLETGLLNALAVLLVACPCALGFAVPLAVWQTLGQLASKGLVADGGDVVERLAGADTVVFDKTGTLTTTSDRILDIVAHPDSALDRDRVLELASAVEATTQHPLSQAFRSSVDPCMIVESTRILPGRGVEGRVRVSDGREHTVRIGTPEIAGDPHRLVELRRLIRSEKGAHEIVITVDGETAGLAAIDETPHHALKETLEKLERLGIQSILATGDNEVRAARLGFSRVHARQKPDDKRALVESLRNEGRRVLFIGDGINDAAGMAEADVGIAASSGADLAADVADLVWYGRDPRIVPTAVDAARRSVRTIRENLAWAAAYNLAGMSVAAAGLLHPVFAAVLMVGSSLFITLRTTVQTGDRSEDVSENQAHQVARPRPVDVDEHRIQREPLVSDLG